MTEPAKPLSAPPGSPAARFHWLMDQLQALVGDAETQVCARSPEAIFVERISALKAELAGMRQEWEPIATIPECDDLMWFCRGDAYEGPREMHGDEADYFDWWCYAKPPSLPKPPSPGTDGA